MNTYITVHAVIRNDEGKFLILQRADHRTNPGTWNHVTGYIQDRESAEEAALREMKEETGLIGAIMKSTEPFWVELEDTRWVVISSLIEVLAIEGLKIDGSESKDHDWIDLDDSRIMRSEGMRASFAKLGLL